MKKAILFLPFLFVLGFAKAQTINFQVVVIFKPSATWADITSIKTALSAVQLDSTFPSRALLWRCSATVGSTITIPKLGGGTVVSAAITSGGGGSEAVGVVCNSGQSEGVSLNDVYIIPERDSSQRFEPFPMFGTTGCPPSVTDSIVTCSTGRRALRMAIMDSGIDIESPPSAAAIVIRHDSLKAFVAYRTGEPIDGIDNDGNGYKDDQIGFDFVNNQGVPKDSTGHGTFVAGVIRHILKRNGGDTIKFYVLKVLDKQNRGYEYNFIRALDWAMKQKVEVVNCSFISSDELMDTMQPFAAAINTAQNYGLLVSVAAGNRTKNLDINWYGAPSFQSQNMIVTGATACTDSIAWFSNFGKRNVDVFTIGKDIVSTWLDNQWARHSGTSYAAPQTSAVAALLNSRLTSSNWGKVKCAILMGSSYRAFLLQKDRRSGILNAVNAANLLATVTFPCDGLVSTEGVFENLKSVVVFPNPTAEDVLVNFYLTKNATVSLSVLNTMGQTLSTQTVNSVVGLNEYPLSIKGENGLYFVQIKVGNEVVARKVVKFEP
jgi:Subtilase family/Secretion system C-terminal sorting domain